MQKTKRQGDEIFNVPPPTSTHVMENFVEKCCSYSLQVGNGDDNLRMINGVDIERHTTPIQPSGTECKGPKLTFYSRRSSGSGQKQKKRHQNSSQETFQKNAPHYKNLSVMKSAKGGCWRKENNDPTISEGSLNVKAKENDPFLHQTCTVLNPNEEMFLASKSRRRRRSKKKRNIASHAKQVSVGAQERSVSVKYKNIDSVRNGDSHLKILSSFAMKKEATINQGILAKLDGNGVQLNATIFSTTESDSHCSLQHKLNIPASECTYERCRNSGQQGKSSHMLSYLNSQDNKSDPCIESLITVDASEAECKRLEDINANVTEHPSHVDGGSYMNSQASRSLTCSHINYNVHKERLTTLEKGKKSRKGRRKKKILIRSNPLPENEDMGTSMKLKIIEFKKNDKDLETFSKSETDSIKPNSEKAYRRREWRAKKELKNDDATSGEVFLNIVRKQSDPMREDIPTHQESRVAIDTDQNKEKIFGSKTRRWRRRRNTSTYNHAKQVSVREQNVSKKYGDTVSVKNGDFHPEILSKSVIKMENNIDQRMLAELDGSSTQINSTTIFASKSDVHHSPEHRHEIPLLKCTYKRCKNLGRLNSQENKHDFCNGSFPRTDASEAECKKVQNVNSCANESPSHAEADGESCMYFQHPSCMDIKSNNHEVNSMDLELMNFRGRGKKDQSPIYSNPLPTNEDTSMSTEMEIIEAEKSHIDPEVCSKSEIEGIETHSTRTYRRRKVKKDDVALASKNSFQFDAHVCNVFPKMLGPKHEELCQDFGEILLGEKSNSKDKEKPLVDSTVDDTMSDTNMKVNISYVSMAMPLVQRLLTNDDKKLLVLDLNGLLVDVVNERHPYQVPAIRVSGKPVYKRPFSEHFLEFCFERFKVGVWSSRQRKNIDVVVNFLFGENRSRLLFVWDLSKCSDTGFQTLKNKHKPLVLKELKKLWNKEDEVLPWEKGDYSPKNTLLIDDSPYKALCNPPHTAIFPVSYDYRNENDNALGPDGDIRSYLEQLAVAENVQNYVKEHPFGQRAIEPGCEYWGFYLQIIKKMQTSFASARSF